MSEYIRPAPEEEWAMIWQEYNGQAVSGLDAAPVNLSFAEIIGGANGPHDGDPEQQPTPEDVAAMLARFQKTQL